MSQWQQESEMMMRCVCVSCKNVFLCIWIFELLLLWSCTCGCVRIYIDLFVCKCVFGSLSKSLYVCVLLRHGRCFLVFRAVQRRPLQGRGVGGRRGQHAQLWGSLASGRGHSPPHFLWWTDEPCSAWLQKKTAIWGEMKGRTGEGEEIAEWRYRLRKRKHSHRQKHCTANATTTKTTTFCKNTCTKSTYTCMCLYTDYT